MTTNQHAAPWTMKRIMQMLAPAPRRRPPTKFGYKPIVRKPEICNPCVDLLTGREAAAHALAFEANENMHEYDKDQRTRDAWLAAADRRITTQQDIDTAHAWGMNLSQWHQLTDHERAEARRTVTTAPRFQEAS